ncbi:MAG: hypothetical protein EPO60_05805 [Rugosibacter sp.]|nr:MAG: hypothetical protein EPO60_05805 [Rugosibacter sp.]
MNYPFHFGTKLQIRPVISFSIFMHANESSNGGDRESGYLPPLMAVVYPDPTCGTRFTRLKAEPGIGNSLCRYGEY